MISFLLMLVSQLFIIDRALIHRVGLLDVNGPFAGKQRGTTFFHEKVI